MDGPLTLEQAHTHGFTLVVTHTERFLNLVDELDPADLDRPVPGLAWTVGETIAHVRSVYERYTSDPDRVPDRGSLAQRNAADIARLGDDPDAAAASIRTQLATLAPVVEHVAPDQRFPFHAGQEVTLAAGWGNLLGELLAHGDDIARATGRRFTIPSADLEVLCRYTSPVLQGWLRPETTELAESWRLSYEFGDIDVVIDHGSLRWDMPPLAAPDHRLVINDAADFALQVPYRRRPVTDPEVALWASRFHDL